MSTELEAAIKALAKVNPQQMANELEKLHAIRDWAMSQIGVDYKPGDRVVIISPDPSEVGRGWAAYSEALAIGQTGIARAIDFNAAYGVWQVQVGMDRCWSTHTQGNGQITRYWKGPASETPEGHVPPSPYDQQTNPAGRVKHFYMDARWVAKAPSDAPGPVNLGTRCSHR